AEDGIRDFHVTGVQTCALPIFVQALHVQLGEGGTTAFSTDRSTARAALVFHRDGRFVDLGVEISRYGIAFGVHHVDVAVHVAHRSAERRVGKECGTRGARLGYA